MDNCNRARSIAYWHVNGLRDLKLEKKGTTTVNTFFLTLFRNQSASRRSPKETIKRKTLFTNSQPVRTIRVVCADFLFCLFLFSSSYQPTNRQLGKRKTLAYVADRAAKINSPFGRGKAPRSAKLTCKLSSP